MHTVLACNIIINISTCLKTCLAEVNYYVLHCICATNILHSLCNEHPAL